MTTNTTLDPALENGTSASTQPGDNLLADFISADAAGFRALALHAGGRAIVDDELGLSMGDGGSACYFGNVAHAARPLTEAGAREAVRRLRRFYGDAPGGPFLVFTPWPLGDLRSDGFALAGHPPLMVRPVGAELPQVEGAGIVHAVTAQEVRDFDQTLAEAYPADALLPYGTRPPLFGTGVSDTGWKLVTAYVGDQPVATAAAFASDQVVAIDAVSTRPLFRGRGIGALVTATAASTAPTVPAALLSSDGGRPVYARLGFLPVMRFTLWVGER